MKPSYCFFLFFISTLFLTFGFSVSANAKFRTDLSVSSEVKDFGYYNVKSYFIQETYLFNRLYALEFPKYKLEVKIEDNAVSNTIKNGTLLENVVILTNQKLLSDKSYDFEKTLIKSFLLAESSVAVGKCSDSDIQWILAGTLREVEQQKFFHLEYPDFPIVNAMIRDKKRIECQGIITHSFEKKDGIFYIYFSEMSQILLDTILKLKGGKKFVFEYIKWICRNPKIDKLTLFCNLLIKHQADFGLNKEDILNSFNALLNKTAAEMVINPRMPISSNQAVNEFVEITKIKDSAADKEIDISELGAYLKGRKDRVSIVRSEKVRLEKFASSCNFLLAQSVREMISILNGLETAETFNEVEYKNAMDVQKAFFLKAASRLTEIEKYLYETEKSKINTGKRYDIYIQELNKEKEIIRDVWPELQKFLDENYPIDIEKSGVSQLNGVQVDY